MDEKRAHCEHAALRDKTRNRARGAGLCRDLGLREYARMMRAWNNAKGAVATVRGVEMQAQGNYVTEGP